MIKKILATQIGVDEGEIVRESNFIDDLGADDIDMFEIKYEIEEHYGISIPYEDYALLRNAGDLSSYLENEC